MRAEQHGLGAIAENVLELAEARMLARAHTLGAQLPGAGAQDQQRVRVGGPGADHAGHRREQARTLAAGSVVGAEPGGQRGVTFDERGHDPVPYRYPSVPSVLRGCGPVSAAAPPDFYLVDELLDPAERELRDRLR